MEKMKLKSMEKNTTRFEMSEYVLQVNEITYFAPSGNSFKEYLYSISYPDGNLVSMYVHEDEETEEKTVTMRTIKKEYRSYAVESLMNELNNAVKVVEYFEMIVQSFEKKRISEE